jgi:hypothetical protein
VFVLCDAFIYLLVLVSCRGFSLALTDQGRTMWDLSSPAR